MKITIDLKNLFIVTMLFINVATAVFNNYQIKKQLELNTFLVTEIVNENKLFLGKLLEHNEFQIKKIIEKSKIVEAEHFFQLKEYSLENKAQLLDFAINIQNKVNALEPTHVTSSHMSYFIYAVGLFTIGSFCYSKYFLLKSAVAKVSSVFCVSNYIQDLIGFAKTNACTNNNYIKEISPVDFPNLTNSSNYDLEVLNKVELPEICNADMSAQVSTEVVDLCLSNNERTLDRVNKINDLLDTIF